MMCLRMAQMGKHVRFLMVLAGLLWAVPAIAEPTTSSGPVAQEPAQYDALKHQALELVSQGEQDLYDHDKWRPLIAVMDQLIALHDEMQGKQTLDEAGKQETAWLYLTRAKARFYADGWPATGPAYEDAMMARKVFGIVPADQVPDILWEAAAWYEVLVAAIPRWGEKGKKYKSLAAIDKQIVQSQTCPDFKYKNHASIQGLLRTTYRWIKQHGQYNYYSQAGALSWDFNADGRVENIKLHAEAPYPIQGDRYVQIPMPLRIRNAGKLPVPCLKNVVSIYALESTPVR